MRQIYYVFTTTDPAPKTQSGALTWTFRTLTTKKIDWLRRGFSLSGSTQLITAPISQTLSFSPTADPVPPLLLFICTINLNPVLPTRSSPLLSTNYFSHFLCCLPPWAQTNSLFLIWAPAHFSFLRSRATERRTDTSVKYPISILYLGWLHSIVSRIEKFPPDHAAWVLVILTAFVQLHLETIISLLPRTKSNHPGIYEIHQIPKNETGVHAETTLLEGWINKLNKSEIWNVAGWRRGVIINWILLQPKQIKRSGSILALSHTEIIHSSGSGDGPWIAALRRANWSHQ